MSIKIFLYLMLLVFSFSLCAQPKILVKHQRSAKNLAEIQVMNQTTDVLICYVAIDGHRLYFQLQPRQASQWYKATDIRLNHNSFSAWCDYLYLHPKYKPKKK